MEADCIFELSDHIHSITIPNYPSIIWNFLKKNEEKSLF